MKHVAIIGNGIAGVTAARYIRKLSDYRITMISAESEYFWSRTALMYIYMGHMKFHHTKPYEDWFWEKNRIDLIFDYVEEVDTKNKLLKLKKGEPVNYDILILATGSKANKMGWKGEDAKGVCTMVSIQDLENIETNTQNVDHGVIVGGGLIGIELAEMLLSRNIDVTFLVREKSFWNQVLPPEESEIVNNHIKKHNVNLKLETELEEICTDTSGRVNQIITKSGDIINCQFVGLTVGVNPQVGFLQNSSIKIDKGILVNEFLQTNTPDVYAIGDCAQHINPPKGRKAIEQIWYSGRIHGEAVARNICGQQLPYEPGVFFNSAKFFDIEYQIYGTVPIHETEELTSFFWEKDDKSLRIVYRKNDFIVMGFNLLGIRYRQHVCERWIKTEAKLKNVIANLSDANFDPEFHKKHEPEIRQRFVECFPEYANDIQPPRKKVLGLF